MSLEPGDFLLDSPEAELEVGDLLRRGLESSLEVGDLLAGGSEPAAIPEGLEQLPGPWAIMAATTLHLVASILLLPPPGEKRGHHLPSSALPGVGRGGGPV